MKKQFVLAPVIVILAAMQLSIAQQSGEEQPVDTALQQEPTEVMRPEPEFNIDEITCGTSVVDRELEGAATSFPAGTEKVYCWTLITGCEEPTTIEHIWYLGGVEMARVPLEVNYPRVRTWSSKTMLPEWSGDWKVELADKDGNVLAHTEFTIE